MKFRHLILLFFSTILLLVFLLGIRYGFPENALQLLKKTTRKLISDKDPKNSIRTTSNVQIESLINKKLNDLEVPSSEIKRHLFLEDTTLEIKASVPKGKPFEWIIWYLSSSIDKSGYRIGDCYCESESKGCTLRYLPLKKGFPVVQLIIKRSNQYFSQSAKMAILIEDFGFDADQTTVEYLSFPEPLTVSLVPSRKLATWTAQIANEYRKEIMILIPMETLPRSSKKYQSSMLMIHYPEEQIKSILDGSIESIPNFAGFGNLYGDKILSDSRVTEFVFDVLKKHHGYFLYTPVTRKSVVAGVAKRLDVPMQTVDAVIDSGASLQAIQDTLKHFAIVAQKTGDLILKAQPSRTFITALKNELPLFHQNGIRLVYVSEIIGRIKKK